MNPHPWYLQGRFYDNLVRSTLALGVIFFAGSFLFGWPEGIDVANTRERAAIVMGIIGLILGYYFGTKGVDTADKRADDAIASVNSKVNAVGAHLVQEKDKLKQELSEAKAAFADSTKTIRTVAAYLEENKMLDGFQQWAQSHPDDQED